uniref:Uncharacterized protein n=1 Tax=Sphaerodactylus townsendi TaxID=933632 RepID=A0ACB8EIQ9_9SAUR
MATQVEALLPANSLLPSEEHGLVIKKPQEKGEHLMHPGEKASTDEGKRGGPDSCSKEGGGSSVGEHLRRNGALKPPSIKQQKEDSNNQEKENLLHQRSAGGGVESNRLPCEAGGSSSGGEEGGVGRKEFIEAPPPKVNPWTKNAPAALVTLNGQSPAEPSSGHLRVLAEAPRVTAKLRQGEKADKLDEYFEQARVVFREMLVDSNEKY